MENKIILSGKILFNGCKIKNNKKKYYATIFVQRLSGNVDRIPLMISEENYTPVREGSLVKIRGYISSSYTGTKKTKLELCVNVKNMKVLEQETHDTNRVILQGLLKNYPKCRLTPNGTEISDIFLLVSNSHRKSDFIPCICWGECAKSVTSLKIDSEVKISGRFQSREYIKRISDFESESRIAYEVSVKKIINVEERNEKSNN